MDECGGVRINFPSSDSKKDVVKLHGPKEDVEKAKAMLKEIADEQVRRIIIVCGDFINICIDRLRRTTLLRFVASLATTGSSLVVVELTFVESVISLGLV